MRLRRFVTAFFLSKNVKKVKNISITIDNYSVLQYIINIKNNSPSTGRYVERKIIWKLKLFQPMKHKLENLKMVLLSLGKD